MVETIHPQNKCYVPVKICFMMYKDVKDCSWSSSWAT